MKILIGTASLGKLSIIEKCLERSKVDFIILPFEVESRISDQPLNEKETIRGSINRALNAINKHNNDFDLSLGLEAGLEQVNKIYHLVCVVSIIDKDKNEYTGISKKIPLPKKVSKEIENNGQFSEAIREFEKNEKTESSDIKNLVNELINRTESFSEAFNIAFMKYKNRSFFI
ncbi:MAG: DUF84 family protein [Candidatus Pacebacteria bacterium]|nr:DUF84 family protein [Candidatus Paceibacterota bacterium]